MIDQVLTILLSYVPVIATFLTAMGHGLNARLLWKLRKKWTPRLISCGMLMAIYLLATIGTAISVGQHALPLVS